MEPRELRSFRIALTKPMGSKRGQGKGAFVPSVVDLVNDFYEHVVGQLKPWSPTPPKLRHPADDDVADPTIPAVLVSTALSSQDEVEESPSVETLSDESTP